MQQQVTGSHLPVSAPTRTRSARPLGAVEAGFIQNWGALARSFGMDPVLGRVHALAFLCAEAISTELVADTLGLELEQASSCLASLQRWGAVREVGAGSDDERLFEADGDPWSWFLVTLKDRGRREFGPLLQAFREANARAQELRGSLHPGARAELRAIERIARFSEFVDQIAGLIETFANLGAGPMMAAMRMVARVRSPRLARI